MGVHCPRLMSAQPGRVISVRVNPSELRVMDEIAREKNMKMARMIKEAVFRLYSDDYEAKLNQDILVLENRVKNLENELAVKNAAIEAIKKAFKKIDDHIYFLDTELTVS